MSTLLKMPPVRDLAASEPPLISVAEYHRRIETGEIGEDERVELIHGVLVPKMPKNPLHTVVAGQLFKRLAAILDDGFSARKEDPITLSDSEPEPDLVVARGMEMDFLKRHPHPTEVELIVEVSFSSLRFDRESKLPLYAENGISCYWIVNLVDFQIEVFEDQADGEYRKVRVYAKDESVPIVVDGSEIGRVSLNELTKTKQGA